MCHFERILALTVVGMLAVPATADITYGDFAGVSTLNRQGDAQLAGDRLRITDNDTGQVGTAWHEDKQFVRYGFETQFTFQLSERISGGSDGFAFALQSSSGTAVGTGSSDMGYTNIPGVVAVEFDTYQNLAATPPNYSDPAIDHIAVMTGSNHATQQIGSATAAGLDFGTDEHVVKIIYDPAALAPGNTAPGRLDIYLDDLINPLLSVAINFDTVQAGNTTDGQGRAYLGFTAGTGGGTQNHDILDWTYVEVLPEPTAAGLLICGMWPMLRRRNADR